LLSIALASAFFSGVNVGADTVAKQALDKQLSQVPVDIRVYLPHSPLSAANITKIVKGIRDLNIQEITGIEPFSQLSGETQILNNNKAFLIFGISENSRVYDGLTVRNGSPSLGVANETYVWAGSLHAGDIKLGDVLQFNITLRWVYEGREQPKLETLLLNLTVVGFVDLDEQAQGLLSDYIGGFASIGYAVNVLIVDWNKTFAKMIDLYYSEGLTSNTKILIFLDRGSLINPWDIDGSISRIEKITSQIGNKISILTGGWAYVYNQLESTLNNYRAMSQSMRFTFILLSIPVFFIAWYMGTAVSDVSYNLRRREIGLLLTKGFSRRQLLRMFLGEAVLIALIGGAIGIGLSFLMTPFFVLGEEFFATMPVIGIDTIISTIVFSVVLTLLSVFQPARRSSKLDIVEALKEYRYVEEVKPYKKKWPWIAFILGSYKIAMWLLGINTFTLMTRGPLYITNIFIMILMYVWIYFDTIVLNFLGPILFFWGFTKIFIRGSLKFQEIVTRIVKFAGDLGTLSTKNVRRNPARAAAIAFLIAMITGYGFQIIGSYASEQDYQIRQVKFTVGADISIQMSTLQNLSSPMNMIRNVSEVSALTAEYRFYSTQDGQYMTFIAVNPEDWLNIAYYESGLFTGGDITSAFQEMKNSNNTTILERGIAETLKLRVGDPIAVTFGSKVLSLRVVGFFGPEPSWTPLGGSRPSYWSYVPEGLYQSVKNETYPSGKILVKTAVGANGTAIAKEIRNLRLSDVSSVLSVAEILEQQQTSYFPIPGMPPLSFGSIEIQRLGVAFAVLAASLGTALVTFVSLKERSREVGIMSVRGLSFKQVVGVLLVENLAVVAFAVFLGAVVGLIIIQGNISAANSFPTYTSDAIYSISPIQRRMVFPLDSILALTACCSLVFASTVIPIFFMAKRYVSELERIVRGA